MAMTAIVDGAEELSTFFVVLLSLRYTQVTLLAFVQLSRRMKTDLHDFGSLSNLTGERTNLRAFVVVLVHPPTI